MKSCFKIYQTSTEFIDRPPISHKVREYFEAFVIENVFEKKNIVINSKWDIVLHICFGKTGPKVLFTGVALGKGARTVSAEKIKMYDAFILIEPILTSAAPHLTTIELLYEAIRLFLTSTYKKVKPEFMNGLWHKADLEYLLSLPYPASFKEQKYSLDEHLYKVGPDGAVSKITLQEQSNWSGYRGGL